MRNRYPKQWKLTRYKYQTCWTAEFILYSEVHRSQSSVGERAVSYLKNTYLDKGTRRICCSHIVHTDGRIKTPISFKIRSIRCLMRHISLAMRVNVNKYTSNMLISMIYYMNKSWIDRCQSMATLGISINLLPSSRFDVTSLFSAALDVAGRLSRGLDCPIFWGKTCLFEKRGNTSSFSIFLVPNLI